WADVKNRLDSDRRCYGFFHPNLPDEPLIFIEVAFTQAMADSITPLLDEGAAPVDPASSSSAVFYSISNTQRGLRGVSFGDSLIKRVVETLREEFPKLRQFATLSPIPGLRGWLGKNATDLLARLDDKERGELSQALGRPRRRPRPCWPRWRVRWRCPRRHPCARCCCAAPPTTWRRAGPTASRRMRWRASIWATAPAWNASTGAPTLQPRGSSNPGA